MSLFPDLVLNYISGFCQNQEKLRWSLVSREHRRNTSPVFLEVAIKEVRKIYEAKRISETPYLLSFKWGKGFYAHHTPIISRLMGISIDQWNLGRRKPTTSIHSMFFNRTLIFNLEYGDLHICPSGGLSVDQYIEFNTFDCQIFEQTPSPFRRNRSTTKIKSKSRAVYEI